MSEEELKKTQEFQAVAAVLSVPGVAQRVWAMSRQHALVVNVQENGVSGRIINIEEEPGPLEPGHFTLLRNYGWGKPGVQMAIVFLYTSTPHVFIISPRMFGQPPQHEA
ncbi:hypothetical protein [Sorangium sp. So ce861]|uniref:hypothetical protein n=1 Tax=Sorangium sp. So ce861 TaxID=3133323 RepID=UPI003F63F99B